MSYPFPDTQSQSARIYSLDEALALNALAVRARLSEYLRGCIEDGYSNNVEIEPSNYPKSSLPVIIEFLDECKAKGYTVTDVMQGKRKNYVIEW